MVLLNNFSEWVKEESKIKNYIAEAFKNLIGKDCLITLVTKKVHASIILKDLDIYICEERLFIHEKDELTGFEIEYETLEIEDLSGGLLEDPQGTDMMIRIGDGEYMEITSLVD